MCLHASINNTYQHKKGLFKHLIGNIYLYCPFYLNVAQKIRSILCVLRKGNPSKYEFDHFEMTPPANLSCDWKSQGI